MSSPELDLSHLTVRLLSVHYLYVSDAPWSQPPPTQWAAAPAVFLVCQCRGQVNIKTLNFNGGCGLPVQVRATSVYALREPESLKYQLHSSVCVSRAPVDAQSGHRQNASIDDTTRHGWELEF